MTGTPKKAQKLLSELSIIDLKRELDRRGLDNSGITTVLVDRLRKVSKLYYIL